jgi:hypothetical protein
MTGHRPHTPGPTCTVITLAEPPICVDAGSMPIKTLAVQS